MKKQISLLLLLFFSLPLMADKWYFPVSTLEKGLVKLPEKSINIMVVNNAVSQPANYGHQQTLYGQNQTAVVQAQDSSIFFCLLSASEIMDNSGFFQTVSLYDESVNKSGRFFELARLSAEQVQQLCRQYQADALLVLNRIVIVSERQSIMDENAFLAALDLRSMASWSYYTDVDDYKTHNFTVCDTLSWENANGQQQQALKALPELKDALLEAAIRAGERACTTLFAHPVEQYRYLFTNDNDQFQKALSYIRKQNWQAAVQTLTPLIDAKGLTSPYASADIALCMEMMGDIQQAQRFAQQAFDDFMRSNRQESQEDALVMKWYLQQLAKYTDSCFLIPAS